MSRFVIYSFFVSFFIGNECVIASVNLDPPITKQVFRTLANNSQDGNRFVTPRLNNITNEGENWRMCKLVHEGTAFKGFYTRESYDNIFNQLNEQNQMAFDAHDLVVGNAQDLIPTYYQGMAVNYILRQLSIGAFNIYAYTHPHNLTYEEAEMQRIQEEIRDNFLDGCAGLLTVDLSQLSNPKRLVQPQYDDEEMRAFLEREVALHDVAQTLIDSNPGMSEELALAWARLTDGDPDRLHRSFNRIDPNVPLNVAGQPEQQLYFSARPGDGDCGYHAMDITREEAAARLIHNINDENIREIIANTLRNALIADQLPAPLQTNEANQLRGEYFNIGARWDALANGVREFYGILPTREEMDDMVQGTHRLMLAFPAHLMEEYFNLLEADQPIQEWCHKNENILTYIRAEVLGDNWLDFERHQQGDNRHLLSIIDALALLDNVNLVIYQQREGDQTTLNEVHRYDTGAPETRYLLYRGGRNGHYDRLLEEPQLMVVPGYVAQQEVAVEINEQQVLSVADALLAWNDTLDPEIKELEADIYNWEAEETIQTYIEALGNRTYNIRLNEMKENLAQRKAAVVSLQGNNRLFAKYLLDNNVVPENAINAALKSTYMFDPLPTVIKPAKLPKNAPEDLDEIIDGLDPKFTFIEVRADGVYAKEKLEKPMQKVHAFEQVDDEGIQKFYTVAPKQGDLALFEEMEAYLQNNSKAINLESLSLRRVQNTLGMAKYLLQQRDNILNEAKRGNYADQNSCGRMLHTNYSDPNSWYYDRVAIDQRLNNIHNSIIQTYLVAKKRGHLKHYFKNAFGSESCMDGQSRGFHDYAQKQEQNLDSDKGYHLKTKHDAFESFYADRINPLGIVTIDQVQDLYHQEFRGTKTKEGIINDNDIDHYIQVLIDLELL